MNKILPAKKLAAVALCALALSGCVRLSGAKVPETLLNLTAQKTAAAGAWARGNYDEAVVVLEPQVDQRLNVTRVPVQVDEANVAYVRNAVWVERPARLFQHLLAETIRANGGGRLVVESDPGASGLRVSGRLLDMGYDARTKSVVVRYDAVVERTGGTVETTRFEAVVPNVKADADQVGVALNKAANDVAAQVAAWIG